MHQNFAQSYKIKHLQASSAQYYKTTIVANIAVGRGVNYKLKVRYKLKRSLK